MPRLLNTKSPKTMIASAAAGEPTANEAASTADLVSEARQLKLMERKSEQLTKNAPTIQQIHIISSDDDDVGDGAALSVISNSGSQAGFAGFPSPGTTNTNNATIVPGITSSSHSLRKHSKKLLQKSSGPVAECSSKTAFGVSGLDLRKRSSLQTLQAELADKPNIAEADLSQVTPVKRKRELNNTAGEVSGTPPPKDSNEISLQTPPPSQQCQVVEVNSNSTTHSLKQKRLLRRSAQNLHINTKCSTESSSEFPVSSPSNPQQPGCSKFLQRPPLLKNTLPADSFERHLAIITSRNPQMTLDDKMSAWQCDPELSDVEDVNTFDDLFQRCEENKRKTLKGTKNKQANATEYKENYDFSHFRNVILKNLKSKSELSAQEQHDRPTTSTGALAGASNAVAAITQRRKAAYGGGDGGEKKRQHTQKKKTQSSTTPPPASSSSTSLSSAYSDDNNVEGSHAHLRHPHKKSQLSKNVPKVLVYEKVLCPSSSEGSQTSKRGTERAMTSKHKLNIKTVDSTAATDGTATAESTNTTAKVQHQKDQASSEADTFAAVIQTNTPPLNLHWTSTEEDSVFRLNRLNREIDKPTIVQKTSCNNKHNTNDFKKGGLIQMRLDFLADKKELNLKEKIVEIFKTPTVPQKYQTPSLNNQTNHQTLSINSNSGNISPPISPQNDANLTAPDEEIIKQPPCAATTVPVAQQQVFHQQHEFCSYLGLTGMSTANAVANAVAELAKCNLARRSLRVRRLQHEQEKNCKDIKERKQLEELKAKQLREIKRRENPRKGSSKEVQHHSTKKEKTTQVPSVGDIKNDPEIKIICQISAENKKRIKKMSKSYVKHITAPIRKTLMQHLKRGRSSLDTSTLPRSSHSEPEEAEEADEDSSSNNTPKPLEKAECSDILTQPKTSIKQENQSTQSPCSSRVSRHNEKLPQHDLAEDNDKMTTNKRITSHSEQVQKLHMKFQEYLEESRRAKPSIFIVQSIDNDKDDEKKHSSIVEKGFETINQEQMTVTPAKEKQRNVVVTQPTFEVVKDKSKQQHRHHSKSVISKRNAKTKLRKLLTRSVLNLSQQRQLRSRKIVILKTTVKREHVSVEQRASAAKHYTNFKTKKAEHHVIQKSTTIPANAGDSNKQSTIVNNGNDTNIAVKVPPKPPPRPDRIKSPNMQIVENERNATTMHRYVPLPQHISVYEQQHQAEVNHQSPPQVKASENDIVVVSSTTNYYDETKEISTTTHVTGGEGDDGVSAHAPSDSFTLKKDIPLTKDAATQSIPSGIYYWSTGSSLLPNPLKAEHGKVFHIYYELDILIVVQEELVSFWKYSKLLNVLNIVQQQHTHLKQHLHQQQQQREVESTSASLEALAEWVHLGECKRLIYDTEISSPYPNRICVHNSLPIYIEMRCKELQKERRDCNLLSLYINVYYYNDEDMHAKIHSIQLDSVQSLPKHVIFTTITDSRYFVMSWPQENMLGKKRSGLCKYSLTPHLDTLASIREFKSMRHEICYLECTDDDKLLGFGVTELTIWDHRSGDVLMNYDLDMNLGQNLGSVFYPSLEIGQNNIILLFQFFKSDQWIGDGTNVQCENTSLLPSTSAEVHVIACNISHVSPSHRVLYKHVLPSPSFNEYKNASNTGEHLIITAPNDEEIWLNCGDPKMLTIVPAQFTQRFYTRGRSQLIELTERTLTIDCFANHVLKIVAAAAALT